MFYSLTGKIIYKDEQTVAISCGGVGFKCFTTRNSLAKLSLQNGEITVFYDKNNGENNKVSGTVSNDAITEFRDIHDAPAFTTVENM